MASLKGHQIEAFLSKPDFSYLGYLIYGPELGLVSNSLDRLKKTFLAKGYESETISADRYASDGLHVESLLNTDSLFAPSQVYILDGSASALGNHLKELNYEAISHSANRFCIFAGDLKPTSALRKAAEQSGQILSLPCYADSDADKARLIESFLAKYGLQLSNDARQLLLSQLSDNRLINLSELEKLSLYCFGKTHVSVEDVEAILEDNGASQIDALLDACFLGNVPQLTQELQRFSNYGLAEEMLFASLSRHLSLLYSSKLLESSGLNSEQALQKGFGYIHFSRKTALANQMRRWSLTKLEQCQGLLHETERNLRLNAELKQQLLERLLLRFAMLA